MSRLLVALLTIVAALPGLAVADSPGAAGRVSVVYENPEKFTDVKDTASRGASSAKASAPWATSCS